jgi:hypothetical protein
MKKFNRTISIQVEVDVIAEQLVLAFASSFPHSELVAESVIGTILNGEKSLSCLYNALNGYTNEINFVENEYVKFKDEIYFIKKIDIYRKDKLLLDSGRNEQPNIWVNHTECTSLTESETAEAVLI